MANVTINLPKQHYEFIRDMLLYSASRFRQDAEDPHVCRDNRDRYLERAVQVDQAKDMLEKAAKQQLDAKTYGCEQCLADPRVVSKDGKHRLCVKCQCEVTTAECARIRGVPPEARG